MPVGGFLAGLFCFEVDNLCAVGEKVDAIKHPRDQLATKHHIERAFPPKFHVRIRFGQALGRLEVRPFSDIGRPEITVARREVAYGISPFPSALDELG